jgi:hypothetical protein
MKDNASVSTLGSNPPQIFSGLIIFNVFSLELEGEMIESYDMSNHSIAIRERYISFVQGVHHRSQDEWIVTIDPEHVIYAIGELGAFVDAQRS